MKKQNFSRRDFLGKTIAGLAGTAALGNTPLGLLTEQSVKKQTESGPLIIRSLGKTGIRLPVVSMGVMNADSPALLRRAFEMGIRHFDTAAVYQRGRNEEMVGTVIKELGARDQVTIATKQVINPQQQKLDPGQAKTRLLEMLNASLKRLQTDYLDILYLHNVENVSDIHHSGLMEGLQEAKKSGKTRSVGFSTHANMTLLLDEAAKMGFYDVILTTYNYSLAADSPLQDAMTRAAAEGIGLIAMKTQCQQDWYREELPPEMQAYYGGQIVHPALLKWVLRHEFVATAVPGFVNFQQLEEDMPCARTLDYTPEEKKFLDDRKVKLAMSAVCRQCRSCTCTCPHGVNVAELIRVHMYAKNYGNFAHARHCLENLPKGSSLSDCNCTSCQARCVRQVNIASRIEELKLIYG